MPLLDDAMADIAPLQLDPDGSISAHLDILTKPQGSLGRLEELALWYVSIRAGGFSDSASCPRPKQPEVFVMAGDHGVARKGVSAFPPEVTPQMVSNFLTGGAAINVLARRRIATVTIVDCGVAAELPPHPNLLNRKLALGTDDLSAGPAMTANQARASIEIGIDCAAAAAARGADLLATGDMGIGNTTPSTAMLAAFTGLTPATITGRGTGVNDKGFHAKIQIIKTALDVNRPDPTDPLDVLAKVGGFEIGAIAGLCLGAARHRIPILVDGFISTAGALLASRLCPAATGYMKSAHQSVEVGHAAMLRELGLRPLIDLDLRLGEGTGAVLAMDLVSSGVDILCDMATFADAGVSDQEA